MTMLNCCAKGFVRSRSREHAPAATSAGGPGSMFDIGQECGHHAEQRQVRTNAIYELDSVLIGEPTEHGRTDAADAEGEAEKQAGYGTHLAGHQFLREYHDGRERRGQHESDDETQGAGPRQADEWQKHREGRDAQDGCPNDALAADTVADRSAEEGAERHREQKYE